MDLLKPTEPTYKGRTYQEWVAAYNFHQCAYEELVQAQAVLQGQERGIGEETMQQRASTARPSLWLRLKQAVVNWLMKDVHVEAMHFGEHSIVIDGDQIKMNALASDPGTPAEGWLWYLASTVHKLKFYNGTGNKIIEVEGHASKHENGGADEISVAGLSGELADDQPPKAHAANHKDGGSDELDASELAGALGTSGQVLKTDGAACSWGDPGTPGAHASTHEDGGADELDVRSLQGAFLPAGTLASRPAASQAGRYYYATDEDKLYYDNGTSWEELTADPTAHDLAGAKHNADTLADLSSKVSDATLASLAGDEVLTNKTLRKPLIDDEDGTPVTDVYLQVLDAICYFKKDSDDSDATIHVGEVQVGDLKFANDWRLTEDEEHGIVFLTPSGQRYAIRMVPC